MGRVTNRIYELDKVEAAVFEVIKDAGLKGISIDSVHTNLSKSYALEQLRSSVATLWDKGLINIGPDRKLRLVPIE